MTQASNDLTLRPISGPQELDLFNSVPYVLNKELAGDLERGRRRPEWLWMALRGDRLVARVAWWARDAGDDPFICDIFDAETEEDGLQLFEAAAKHGRPGQYTRFVQPDWRDNPEVNRALAMLERTGARLFVERLRLQWNPGTPIPEPAGRLRFRAVESREELVTLMTRVLAGTLDAHSQADLKRLTPEQAAAEQYDTELMGYQAPREWWQIATLPDGEPVGFVIPSHNGYNPIIAYIGVVPEHRGNGFADEVLIKGTEILAAQGVPRIRAATDVGNVPMAKAFQRAGYVNFERQVDMTW